MTADDDPGSDEPEIIPPKTDEASTSPSVYAEITASIAQYTERPDLLIDAIERHDPGFVKEMNEEARSFSRRSRNARFVFGGVQAYATLIVQVVAAVIILGVAAYGIANGVIDGWLVLALAVFYAVTQSGPAGFMGVVGQIGSMFGGRDSDDTKPDS